MSVRVVDRVDGWDQRPFSGGFDALQDLADEELSGVVRAGGAELYMTVGTVVAVRRGDVEDFENTSGTVFSAPAPALPLLAVMQEEDVDVRAQYYSEETPMSEVDGTLSSGGFTGYVELSENVLSGDYFLVYHGGNSMSVAFVGNNQKLVTDDEAFETADDEVGIYKVRQVDVEPIEIPEPASAGGSPDATEATAAAATAEGGAAADETDAAETEPHASPAESTGAEPGTETDSGTVGADDRVGETDEGPAGTDDRPEPAEGDGSPARDTAAAGGSAAAGTESETDAAGTGTAPAEAETAPAETETARDEIEATRDRTEATRTGSASAESTETAAREAETTERSPQPDPGGQTGGRSTRTDSAGRSRTGSEPNRTSGGRSDAGSDSGGGSGRAAASQSADRRAGSGGATQRQAGDLETRSIPSLDPSHTQTPQRKRKPEPTPEPAPEPQQREPETRTQRTESGGAVDSASKPGHEQSGGEATQRESGPAEAADDRAGAPAEALEELEAELADREARVERLESDLADAESEREDLEAELAAVREERDDLAAEVERLEEELERLEQEFGAATDAETRMTPSEAIEATNLFVEYDSKGKATLEDAHGGSEGREAVAENLRLGVHTEFDDRAVAVGGQDFDEFLRGTLHYRFAEWVVGDLLFEIRDTGHADALPDLYDAIGEIRRVEFNGVVDVEYAEDGQDKSGRERFDVIFRHRMGDPLLVANLNDSREPATGNMMTSLVTSAERVGQTEDALASAFLVTSSFFESEALETVSEATQGGLLSRDSRKSFVNLSRKAGYHLCLVAARDGNFHMEVPEL